MLHKKNASILFESSAKKKSDEFASYYKKHPYKFIERYLDIKLTLFQKIMLLIPTKEQRRQKKLDKLLRRFMNNK